MADAGYEEEKEDYFQGQGELFEDIDCLCGI
jgi:hypothetical protein